MTFPIADLGRPLFAGVPVDQVFDTIMQQAMAAVDGLRPGDLLTVDLPGVRRRLVEMYRVDQLRLDWDSGNALASDDGTRVCVFVPFSGAAGLFDMRPTGDDDEQHPMGWVRDYELVLVLEAEGGDPHREFDHQKTLVTARVMQINTRVRSRNEQLVRAIRTRLASRTASARRAARLALEFGPPPPPRLGNRPDERRRSPGTSGGSTIAISPRRPGRRPALRQSILDRFDEAWLATPEPRTYVAIAARFRTLDGSEIGISDRHLRRLRHRVEKPVE